MNIGAVLRVPCNILHLTGMAGLCGQIWVNWV